MKKRHFLAIFILLSMKVCSQVEVRETPFGFTLNVSQDGEFSTPRIVPSLSYTNANNQVEIGLGFQVFGLDQEVQYSLELNHKYYPNARNNKFSFYLLTHGALVHSDLNTYYPASYNYLFLSLGYGFEIKPQPQYGLYLGTNMSLGGYTYNKQSETAPEMFRRQAWFEDFGYYLSLQAAVGWRF